MQLDDLKSVWSAHGALLERNLVINEQLLREVTLRKVRWSLVPYVLWRVIEVVFGLLVLGLAGSVLVAHLHDGRYLLLAGAVSAFALSMSMRTLWLVVLAMRLDYGGPVAAMQRAIEHLTLVEFRTFKWALLAGVVLWLPTAMVLFEAVFGVDVLARADAPWLAANVALGLVFLWRGLRLARKHLERADLRPWARRFVDRVSGRQLAAIRGRLAELAEFVRDDSLHDDAR